MGPPWIVHEGYLQFKYEDVTSHPSLHLGGSRLIERYFVLYMNRKLEMYESNAKERRLESCYVRAYCGWEGHGLLKAGESYGLELKLEKHAHDGMFVAAFNRLELEKWCRGITAVLDPESAAGQEVRRERRKQRKEEKRLEEEKEAKIQQWKEQRRKMIEDEKRRLEAREQEILNMTPLERIDGLGAMDDDTARLLEKRKQRLQRRQAPTTRRVNKTAYRQRLEDAAGGKLENVQPLQAKVVEQRTKVRVEPPPPGQFVEAAPGTRRHSNPARRRRLDDSSDSESDQSSSGSRRSSSQSASSSRGPHSNGSNGGFVPPPPPPPPPPRSYAFDDERPDFVPPPPPPPPPPAMLSGRVSRSNSVRSSVYDPAEQHLESSRASSSRRLSGVDREKQNVQDALAAIMGGRRLNPPAPSRRRDSFDSIAESDDGRTNAAARSQPVAPPERATESTMANAFAASLAAIRRNRTDTVDGSATDLSSKPQRARDRSRESQLSAEGKALLQKAMSNGDTQPAAKPKTNGRKGLFDDSSSDDGNDSDSGLFGARKGNATNGKPQAPVETVPAPRSSQRDRREPSRDDLVDSDDSDSDDGGMFGKKPVAGNVTSPRSVYSSVSNDRNGASGRQRVDVLFKSCVVQNQGKKAVGMYTFAFRAGDEEHSFTNSYHELDDIHERLESEVPSLPKFPSKHWLRNNTKPENMQKRAMEFVEYYQQLVKIPTIFDNQRFVFEYRIPQQFLEAVRGQTPTGRGANSQRATPKSTIQPASQSKRGANAAPSRVTAQFGADDTDSDGESVISAPSPMRAAPVPVEEPPKRKTKSKTSKKFAEQVDDRELLDPGSRRERTKSRSRMKPSVNGINTNLPVQSPIAVPQEPPASIPKIAGLPPRPNLFGGGRGDLLAAIRQGKELKKTGAETAAAPPAGRGAGIPAPRAPPAPAPPAPLTQAGSISEAITNAMAARRIHVEYEDKSDEGEDSDDDWD